MGKIQCHCETKIPVQFSTVSQPQFSTYYTIVVHYILHETVDEILPRKNSTTLQYHLMQERVLYPQYISTFPRFSPGKYNTNIMRQYSEYTTEILKVGKSRSQIIRSSSCHGNSTSTSSQKVISPHYIQIIPFGSK